MATPLVLPVPAAVNAALPLPQTPGFEDGWPKEAVSSAPVSSRISTQDDVVENVEVHPRISSRRQSFKDLTSSRDVSAADLQSLLATASIRSSVDILQTSTERARTRKDIVNECYNILKNNDYGGYTIPAKGLYPYQWNWDSALVALGWAAVDEMRGWQELESLLQAQWSDGMVPHIVFHQPSPSYFPGPEIWGTAEQPLKSTGITQPPVAAISVRQLVEKAKNRVHSHEAARRMLPKLMAWHRWFNTARDPESTGLVAILHPWESGMDNSPAWDAALARVPVDKIPEYTRRDLGHVDSAMRPRQAEYDRYLTLLYRFKNAGYDPSQLYYLSPFRMTDLCTNSVLHRANLDLLWLAEQLGMPEEAAEIRGWVEHSRAAFSTLWDKDAGLYRNKDQLTGELVMAGTSAGFLPLFARVPDQEQAAALAATLTRWLDKVQFGVPSMDPEDARFEALRYWRGPVWAIINWMITDGLRAYGFEALAARIESDTRTLTSKAGLYEYYDPVTGAGAGGNYFSWTAAMCLAWLDTPAAEAEVAVVA